MEQQLSHLIQQHPSAGIWIVLLWLFPGISKGAAALIDSIANLVRAVKSEPVPKNEENNDPS